MDLGLFAVLVWGDSGEGAEGFAEVALAVEAALEGDVCDRQLRVFQ